MARASTISGIFSYAFGLRGRRVSEDEAGVREEEGERRSECGGACGGGNGGGPLLKKPAPWCPQTANLQNLMAWMVAGGIAYYLYVVPERQRNDEQQRVREQAKQWAEEAGAAAGKK